MTNFSISLQLKLAEIKMKENSKMWIWKYSWGLTTYKISTPLLVIYVQLDWSNQGHGYSLKLLLLEILC